MNIILLDKETRKFKASISQFESFIWTERYWEYGDFELVVPLNVRNVSLIGLDDYLRIPTSDTLMIVENIEYVSPVKDEGGKFNITGRSLDSILDRRILFQDYKKSIKAESFITQMVRSCFKDTNNSGRVIDYLYIEENGDSDTETDPVKVDESKGSNLGDIVLKSSKDNELGFRINFKNDGTFHFEVFSGKDKKYIVFSENNLLLQEAKVYQSNAELKTFALVSGADSDINVNAEGSPTGINRREIYSGSYTINKTDPGYRNELELKGKNDLEDHIIVKTIEGQLLNIGKYRLRRDFDLGDLITIQNPYYKAVARITEVIQSWNQEGYLIYPGFMAKDITVLNYGAEEIELPEEEPEPETPDIPIDQTPRKLINVEIISAIKMYTNFIIGGTSRTYHQIYIPNYDPSDPENRPIKRFGVRLRGILPEGWAAGFYNIYCDIFLGSEQKLETIRIKFNPGDQAFIGEWYSYLTYDSPYIRLYLYVVANEVGLIDIPDDQEPFINGLVDIRLNNVDDLEYNPSEEGDQLTCQTTYIWENNGNFHRYCSTNSTNVTGIKGIDITVLRHVCMANTSMLSELDRFIESGIRSYEYDTVSLDNVELTPIESGIIEVPPSGGNYNIPAPITQYENEIVGNFGWRQTVAEVIKSQLASSRVISGSNTQEMNLLFSKKYFDPTPKKLLNLKLLMTARISRKVSIQNSDYARSKLSLHIDNSKRYIKTIKFSSSFGSFYFTNVFIYGDNEKKIEHLYEIESTMKTETVEFYNNDSIDIIIEQDKPMNYVDADLNLVMLVNEISYEEGLTIEENYDINMELETFYSTGDRLYNNAFAFSLAYNTMNQIDSKNDVIESWSITAENMNTALPYDFDAVSQNANGAYRNEIFFPYSYPSQDITMIKPFSYLVYSDIYYFDFDGTPEPDDLNNYQKYISDFPKAINASIQDVKKYLNNISGIPSHAKSHTGLSIMHKEAIAVNLPQPREEKSFNTKYYINYSYSKEV